MTRSSAAQAVRPCAALLLVLLCAACGNSSKAGQPQSRTTAFAVAVAAATQAPAPAGEKGFLGKFYPSQGHTHLAPGEPDDFVYNSNPPTSGPHREIFNDAFISPAPLPKYVQVHLLEHGNVLLQYNCTCPDIVSALSTIATQYDGKLIPPSQLQPMPADVQNAEEQGLAVVVAPYPRMKPKIALTAWTRLGVLQQPDKAKIVSFINAYLHNEANTGQ
ncbi:MAG: hypothetical protein DLM53_04590 [Candidatus Eremiobacter antarcticus]|nr:DUF3105 domain-containing protein [Candidatus Eremiobacteraeota bacterium]PZR62693.1 MAG: hypothetical protein DLM53_04590 [Candidatus Eremiobacter sp. RRmetagenome_bin22]